jgi:hypothetical protein
MGKQIFSGTAWVEIQGEKVLHLKKLKGMHVEYSVIGLHGPVLVHDYRKVGLRAIQKVIKTGQVINFPLQFNSQAKVKVREYQSTRIVIKLKDTADADPNHRLWIVNGIDENIPVYDYISRQIEPIDDSRFAMMAVYHRHPDDL